MGVDFFLPGASFALGLGEGCGFTEQATLRCTALLTAVAIDLAAVVASRRSTVVQEKVVSLESEGAGPGRENRWQEPCLCAEPPAHARV